MFFVLRHKGSGVPIVQAHEGIHALCRPNSVDLLYELVFGGLILLSGVGSDDKTSDVTPGF